MSSRISLGSSENLLKLPEPELGGLKICCRKRDIFALLLVKKESQAPKEMETGVMMEILGPCVK